MLTTLCISIQKTIGVMSMYAPLMVGQKNALLNVLRNASFSIPQMLNLDK